MAVPVALPLSTLQPASSGSRAPDEMRVVPYRLTGYRGTVLTPVWRVVTVRQQLIPLAETRGRLAGGISLLSTASAILMLLHKSEVYCSVPRDTSEAEVVALCSSSPNL